MSDINFKKLKKAIFNAETAGGQLMDHPVIEKGIHEGDRAVGKYAFVPNTVTEMANRFPELGRLGLKNLSSDELEERFKADEKVPTALKPFEQGLEEKLADLMIQHVVDKQGKDIPRIAASWNAGHNLSPEGAQSKLENDPGVESYAEKVDQTYKTPDSLLPNNLTTQELDDKKFKLLKNLINNN